MKESGLHRRVDSTSTIVPIVHKQHEELLGPATQFLLHEEPRVFFVRANRRWRFMLPDQNGNHFVRDRGWFLVGAVMYHVVACEYGDIELVEIEKLLSNKVLEERNIVRDVCFDEEAVRWKGHVLDGEFWSGDNDESWGLV